MQSGPPDCPSRFDFAVAGGLAVVVMLTRLPFRGTMLYHWDSINFARALDHFDVAAGQPHIPGYLLYVLIGRAARWIGGDAQSALVGVSVVGSGLAVGMLYLLAQAMFDRGVAAIAALGLTSSPLFWFYGEIALPHCLDAFLILTALWLSWRIIEGDHGLIVPLAAWLALTGAIRPQSETFLMPLTLYVALRIGWERRLAVALAVWVGGNLTWLVPLLWLSGGVTAYAQTSSAFYARFSESTTIWSGGLWGVTRNAIKLGMYTAYGWSLGIVALALIAVRATRAHGSPYDRRVQMFALWLLPPLTVYLFVHMGQQGLVFVFLPALCLLTAVLLRTVRPSLRAALTAMLVVGNSLIFLVAPTYPLGGDRPKLLTTDTLHRHDDALRARLAAVRALSPAHTMLLASQWRFPEYYLPEYPLVRYTLGARWEVDEGRPTTAHERWVDPARSGVRPDAQSQITVVLFDEELVPFNRSPHPIDWIPLDNGERLPVLRVSANERLQLLPEFFTVAVADAERKKRNGQ